MSSAPGIYGSVQEDNPAVGYCNELLRLAAGGWQPIATAPRDCVVLIYCPPGVYSSGYEYGHAIGPCMWSEGDGLNPPGWYGVGNPRCYPTHWQPLPAPPAAPTESAADTTEGER